MIHDPPALKTIFEGVETSLIDEGNRGLRARPIEVELREQAAETADWFKEANDNDYTLANHDARAVLTCVESEVSERVHRLDQCITKIPANRLVFQQLTSGLRAGTDWPVFLIFPKDGSCRFLLGYERCYRNCSTAHN